MYMYFCSNTFKMFMFSSINKPNFHERLLIIYKVRQIFVYILLFLHLIVCSRAYDILHILLLQ